MLRHCIAGIALVLAAVVVSPARATAQMSDLILVDGTEYALTTNPLGRYLERLGREAPRFDPPHTALWRGYVASWELVGGRLLLRKVEGYRHNPAPDDNDDTDDGVLVVDGMAELFPGPGRVIASWYTGALVIPDGKLVEYVHMGYGSTYERYIVSIVRQGVEVERHALSLPEFEAYRDAKFEAFRQTEAYRRAFEESKARGGMSDAQIERFIRAFAAERYLSVP